MNHFRTFICLLAASGVLMPLGCHRERSTSVEQPLPVVTVRVMPVTAGKYVATEEVIGTVRARLRAQLEAKVSGRIVELTAAPGQFVKTGERLARLDAGEIRAKADQAKALLEQAERDLARYRPLLQQNAITRQEFEAVESRHRVAEASVTEAEAMLSYAEILAPFDGVITRKLAEVGDLAAPGRPLLELEAPDAMRLEADVGETLIDRLSLNQKVPVRVPTIPTSIEGTIVEIAPTADAASRTFLVKLDLPATPGLRAGSFGRVAIPVGENRILRVASSAVIQRGQLEYVFVAVEGRAQLRLVKTGKRHGSDIELLAGVLEGESIVVENVAALVDGQRVEAK